MTLSPISESAAKGRSATLLARTPSTRSMRTPRKTIPKRNTTKPNTPKLRIRIPMLSLFSLLLLLVGFVAVNPSMSPLSDVPSISNTAGFEMESNGNWETPGGPNDLPNDSPNHSPNDSQMQRMQHTHNRQTHRESDVEMGDKDKAECDVEMVDERDQSRGMHSRSNASGSNRMGSNTMGGHQKLNNFEEQKQSSSPPFSQSFSQSFSGRGPINNHNHNRSNRSNGSDELSGDLGLFNTERRQDQNMAKKISSGSVNSQGTVTPVPAQQKKGEEKGGQKGGQNGGQKAEQQKGGQKGGQHGASPAENGMPVHLFPSSLGRFGSSVWTMGTIARGMVNAQNMSNGNANSNLNANQNGVQNANNNLNSNQSSGNFQNQPMTLQQFIKHQQMLEGGESAFGKKGGINPLKLHPTAYVQMHAQYLQQWRMQHGSNNAQRNATQNNQSMSQNNQNLAQNVGSNPNSSANNNNIGNNSGSMGNNLHSAGSNTNSSRNNINNQRSNGPGPAQQQQVPNSYNVPSSSNSERRNNPNQLNNPNVNQPNNQPNQKQQRQHQEPLHSARNSSIGGMSRVSGTTVQANPTFLAMPGTHGGEGQRLWHQAQYNRQQASYFSRTFNHPSGAHTSRGGGRNDSRNVSGSQSRNNYSSKLHGNSGNQKSPKSSIQQQNKSPQYNSRSPKNRGGGNPSFFGGGQNNGKSQNNRKDTGSQNNRGGVFQNKRDNNGRHNSGSHNSGSQNSRLNFNQDLDATFRASPSNLNNGGGSMAFDFGNIQNNYNSVANPKPVSGTSKSKSQSKTSLAKPKQKQDQNQGQNQGQNQNQSQNQNQGQNQNQNDQNQVGENEQYYNPGFLPSWNQGAMHDGLKQILPGFATPGFGSDEKRNHEEERENRGGNRAENRRENRAKHRTKNQKSEEEEKINGNENMLGTNMLGNQDNDQFGSNNLGEGNAIQIGGNLNRALGNNLQLQDLDNQTRNHDFDLPMNGEYGNEDVFVEYGDEGGNNSMGTPKFKESMKLDLNRGGGRSSGGGRTNLFVDPSQSNFIDPNSFANPDLQQQDPYAGGSFNYQSRGFDKKKDYLSPSQKNVMNQ